MIQNPVTLDVIIYDELSLNAQLVAALDQVITHTKFKNLSPEDKASAAIWVVKQFKPSQHNERE